MAIANMIKPRMRRRMGAFESSAAAKRPRAKIARIAVATQSPVLSAKSRAISLDRPGKKMASTPIAAMNAHRIKANAVISAFYRFNSGIPNFYLGYENTI